MTIWKINPAVPAPKGGMDDDLADMMAALDALPTEKRSAPRKAPAAATPKVAAEPVFVQQWFPKAIICHATEQVCKCCGSRGATTTGFFLEDQHRNGAIRQVRVEASAIPPEYYGLPKGTKWEEESIAFCHGCFELEFFVAEPELPSDLVRALSQDDLNSLKEGA